MKRSTVIDLAGEVPIGVAQVMLQPSRVTGVIFIAGLFWNSWQIALYGLAGCVAGILAAFALRYPDDERREGLYGFNGTLVGLGCAYFFVPSWPLLALVVAGAGGSSIVMRTMLRHGMKPFTFPFVVTTWVLFAILAVTGWATPIVFAPSSQHQPDLLAALSRGVGQVLFQEALLTGMVFALAIAMRDLIQGFFALLGTGLGLAAGHVFQFPVDAVNLGLFGYSGVLCAILFAGRTVRDIALAVTAVALSIVIVRFFHIAELPAFTFPFVLASWIVIGLQRRMAARP